MEKQKIETEKLVADIVKYFPKFFGDFSNWQYGNGTDAGKHFKRIFNRAKKIKTILLLLFSFISLGQTKQKDAYIAMLFGVDVRNAIVGSNPTNNLPEADLITKLVLVGEGFEVNVAYERFNAIGFSKLGVGVGYHIPLYSYVFGKEIKTVFIPSIEPCTIDRWEKHSGVRGWYSVGINASLRWFVSDRIGFEILLNALPRTDLKRMYPELHNTVPIVYSTYVCIIYKLKNK